jgi:hypothetical protein
MLAFDWLLWSGGISRCYLGMRLAKPTAPCYLCTVTLELGILGRYYGP